MKTFILKPEHVALLRNSYWDWDGIEFGAPRMNPKRPYGNSDVLDDMRKILPAKSDDELRILHAELETACAVIMRTAGIRLGKYHAGKYTQDWELTIVGDG